MPVLVLPSVSPTCLLVAPVAVLHIAYAERRCLHDVDERARDIRRSCFPASSGQTRRPWSSWRWYILGVDALVVWV
ncbi:hypothetical protein IWW34DRAFT_756185 [Fusarium oxysporum f. sp. albedinis]|nr:hypothetical protein IWW34DRAFT_756185 [Fusarium oxysporum f. sp. albedinis]